MSLGFLKNQAGRSNCLQMFFKIGGLKNFADFLRKHLSFFFDALRPATLFKKTGVLLWNFWKFQEHLLLNTSGYYFWTDDIVPGTILDGCFFYPLDEIQIFYGPKSNYLKPLYLLYDFLRIALHEIGEFCNL